MGNMIFSKRISESEPDSEMRIFPAHMYNGPKNLGDPNYRGLSKMEADPLVPQRMREVIRTTHCADTVAAFEECGRVNGGFVGVIACQSSCNKMKECMEKHFNDPELRRLITEEYLNERSHFRQTGIKTQRYIHNKWQKRDLENDPTFDDEGRYIPQKPTGWDESYKETGPPPWASYNYKFSS